MTTSTSQITILNLGDRSAWEAAEADGAAPAQCWRYAAALALSGAVPRLALVEAAGSRLLLPFVERSWKGHTDIATVPALSGASIVPASAAPLAEWHAFAASHGWVAGYIQLAAETYPNVPAESSPMERTQMLFVDLHRWHHERTPSLIIRRKAAASIRAGAVVVDDRETLIPALQRLYPQTLSRFGGASPVPPPTIDAWARGPQNLLLGVALDGLVEAVHLVHVHQMRAELHLDGTTDRGRGLSALLYTAVIERLQAMAVARLNLGGADPGSGLYRFKTWLGGVPRPLQTIGQIYDRQKYDALCADAGVGSGEPWFPAYRSRVRHQLLT